MPNFSPIRASIRVLWQILRSVRNEEVEEKKRRNQNEILFARISEMAGAIFFKFDV